MGARVVEPRTGNRRQGAAAVLVVAALAAGGLADVSHVVAPGENLAMLAQTYGTTPQAIAQTNHIANPNLIVVGTRLTIPTAAAPARAPAAAPPLKPPTAQVVTYSVKAGDNLGAIAARYGVTASALAAANAVTNPNLLKVGQLLRIPTAPPAVVEAFLVKYAKVFKVDASLIKAIAWQESGWQQHVISETGAVGVMQIMPGTGRFTAEIILQRAVNTANLERNVEAGVAFFAYLLQQAKGNVQLAVAGYYQGLRSVRQKGMQADTKVYVADVMALKQRFA
jgi:soluble lytic murein transglycosylase-like protein